MAKNHVCLLEPVYFVVPNAGLRSGNTLKTNRRYHEKDLKMPRIFFQ